MDPTTQQPLTQKTARERLREKIRNANTSRGKRVLEDDQGNHVSKSEFRNKQKDFRSKGIQQVLEQFGINDPQLIRNINQLINSGQIKNMADLTQHVTSLVTRAVASQAVPPIIADAAIPIADAATPTRKPIAPPSY